MLLKLQSDSGWTRPQRIPSSHSPSQLPARLSPLCPARPQQAAATALLLCIGEAPKQTQRPMGRRPWSARQTGAVAAAAARRPVCPGRVSTSSRTSSSSSSSSSPALCGCVRVGGAPPLNFKVPDLVAVTAQPA